MSKKKVYKKEHRRVKRMRRAMESLAESKKFPPDLQYWYSKLGEKYNAS